MAVKIAIPCQFGSKTINTDFIVGKPYQGYDSIRKTDFIENPIKHQSKWLYDQKKGVVPTEINEALNSLCEHSLKTGKPVEELVDMAFNKTSSGKLKLQPEVQKGISPTSLPKISEPGIGKGRTMGDGNGR